jgi:hypothetical protein
MVPFEWPVGQTLSLRDEHEGGSWIAPERDGDFVEVVAGALAASLDASDIATVRSMGAKPSDSW